MAPRYCESRLTLPFSGAASGNQRTHERHAARPPLQRFVRQPVWPVTSFISPAPSPTPQPRGHRPAVFAPPSGGGYLTTDNSRTAKAVCAAARHVSVYASDLPPLLCGYGCLTLPITGRANGIGRTIRTARRALRCMGLLDIHRGL